MYYYQCYYSLNTVSISEDSSLLSGGFEDSCVRVWSLTPKKLRMLKSPSELAQIDKEAGEFRENNGHIPRGAVCIEN